ncbi:NAD(P)/FAD-dependent oxidoreductase [Georgenia soli]|uniref:NAD(P)/FAD-dependent oxidoreductase n=1 Tax=Georgenia soli TaxID=638953 RepID=UPI001FE60609|nr:NAD(P)/FAD-dependent oxidoreductase [Georgenia soli]
MTDAPTASLPRYDVVVVGGGPAGLSAALVLGRARRRVLVVDAGRPRNACSASLHGFLTRDGIDPAELLELARSEVERYGVQIARDEVVRATTEDAPDGVPGPWFRVILADGGPVVARRVVVAAGITDVLPEIDGLPGRWGRDVLHCPYCHGHEVSGQALGVVAGSAEGAVHQALLLRQLSDDVTVVLHDVDADELGDRERALLAARGVTVVPGRVEGVEEQDDRLAGVRLANGSVLPCDALFVSPRFVLDQGPWDELAPQTTQNDLGTFLATDPEGRTSVPGLWAVGNVADLSAQVLGAAELGSRAAIGINGELVLADADAALVGQLA